MASTSIAILISAFLLRLLSLALLVASIAVLVTDKFTLILGAKVTFKDVVTYRYVVATSVIGAVYLVIQTPFALYMACKEKRPTREECFSDFDFFGDKVILQIITFLLATGAAAGFAVTIELKKVSKDFTKAAPALGFFVFPSDASEEREFYNRANVASGLVFFAAISMALVSVFSSINRTWRSNGFFSR